MQDIGKRWNASRSAIPHMAPRRRLQAFTLIEIMAVVVIIGLLTTIVGAAVFSQIDRARVNTARAQIKQLEAALDFYRMDNGSYPTALEALVSAPSGESARNWRPEGYLQGGSVPNDPWDTPYEYQSPGSRNPYSFDLWSLGADGAPGGTGVDADLGNWADETSS